MLFRSGMDNIEENGLPSINRYITTHDAEGKAVFSKTIPERLAWEQPLPGAKFSLGYTTGENPVDFSNSQDVSAYQTYLNKPPGLTISGGSVLRLVDMKPGALSPMHRTVSVDYGVVLEGEVDLVLDSGETRRLRRGDIAVQRGTSHAWKNASAITWARMLYVLLEAKPIELESGALGEDYGEGMDGVPSSNT